MLRIVFLLLVLSFLSCTSKKDEIETPVINQMYFPPIGSSNWESVSPESLKWKTENLNDLYDFLATNDTRALIILKNGKIVVEKYWGNDILNSSPFTQNSNWYWASAGKSLTSFLVGLAQQEALVNIEDKSSKYLGEHWTDLPLEKENLITIRHQLCMNTGLDYAVEDLDCTEPSCLQYKTDAGNQWYYHNAAYTLLEEVVSNASGISYNQFTDERLESKIGMNGTWIPSGYNNVYWSTARDAARFGLLILNNGNWENQSIMTDSIYFNAMINSSQDLNPSYGYLWWLNGKNTLMLPGFTNAFQYSLSPLAPVDLVAAMGKNGQFIDVIPSENLVVVRFGNTPDNSLVPVTFQNEMWGKIMNIIH